MISYGIELGLGTVTIDPLEPRPYRYEVGELAVTYSSRAVDLTLPGSGERAFSVHRMSQGARYLVLAPRSRPRSCARARTACCASARRWGRARRCGSGVWI